jgi:putative addiction module component (TIGR02574 family)
MAANFEDVVEQAMTLPPESRARLVDLLVESLDADVPGPHDELWLIEAQRRLDEIRSGRAHTIPGEEALRSVRDSLRR